MSGKPGSSRETARLLFRHPASMNPLRHAVRLMLKQPGLTAVVVLTLALGIGANTVVFSWIRAMLFNAVPGAPRQDRLVVLAPRHKSSGLSDTMSIADIRALREATGVFAGIAGSQIDALPVRVEGGIEWVWSQMAQASFFEVIGVRPVLGRLFEPGEDLPGATQRVAVISFKYWQRRFGGAADVIGRVLEIHDRPATIVGVAPPGFRGTMGGLELDLWIPLSVHLSGEELRKRGESHGWRWLHTVARLKDGVKLDEAQAAASDIGQRVARDFPGASRDTSFAVLPLWKSPWGGQGIFLPLLRALALVAILLLALVTANIANLLIARGQSRESELAVRVALGASPGRIVFQCLIESLLLAVLGGVAGVGLAGLGMHTLLQLLPPTYLPIHYDLGIDSFALATTCAITIVTGLSMGLLPALRSARLDVHETLKSGGRTSSGTSRAHWMRRALVVGEIALACALLVGMGLCARSFQEARRIDLGLNPQNVWLAGFRLSPDAGDAAWANELYRRLREDAARLPGVESAALVDGMPLGFERGSSTGVEIPGYLPSPGESMAACVAVVSPGYFETMQIPLLSGRDFRENDAREATRSVVVNQAFADRFLPGRDPLGKTLRFWGREARIIGVVKTGKYRALNETPSPHLYAAAETANNRNLTLAVRTRGNPDSVARSIERLAVSLDPRLAPFASLDCETYMAAALAVPRVAAVLLTALGVVALFLAALGTYAVVAQNARQRRRELGVRLALGAQPADLLRLILNQGFALAGLGIVVGGFMGIAASRALASVLVGVKATDVAAWVVPPLLMLLATVSACWLPARRASRVDPIEALRNE